MTIIQEQRSRCIRLCQEHFGGAWNRIDGSRMDSSVKPLCGGISNYMYKASLPEGLEAENGEPVTVLLRFYGTAKGDHSTILKDCLVFALLAERGLGPKLYSCFAGGRFEEYIPTRNLKNPEMAYPKHMADIATSMADMHLMEMPLCKEPTFIKDRVSGFLCEIKNNINVLASKPLWRDIIAYNLDIEQELQWLMEVFNSSSSPVKFCHNDLWAGNILKGIKGGKSTFIDFEFSAYNYRGFDFAVHFGQWCFDYHVPVPPYFSYNCENYPTMDQQRTFFRHYMAACGIEPTEAEIQKLHLEAELFAMGHHLVSLMWACKSAISSQVVFGHLEFALVRLKAYTKHKEYLQLNHPSLLEIKHKC